MVKCDRVLQELSNYIDDDVDAELRADIEEHVRGCHRCSVLVDSTRKMLYIVGDERVLEIPIGYSERLHFLFDRTFGDLILDRFAVVSKTVCGPAVDVQTRPREQIHS